MRASRLPALNGDGGLTLQFFNEPTFSYVTPGLAYATYNGPGSNLHSVDQYDFQSGQYSRLLDLESLADGLAGTIRAASVRAPATSNGCSHSSAGPVRTGTSTWWYSTRRTRRTGCSSIRLRRR